MKVAEKSLWKIFYAILILSAINALFTLFGVHLEKQSPLFKLIFLGLPVIFVILHAFRTLSVARGTLLLSLAACTGFISEYLGLTYGHFFGTFYVYNGPQITLISVPVQIIFYWAVFIYVGYSITNSFLLWLQMKKPSHAKQDYSLLLFMILLDGLLVLAIDLFMDPIEVGQGAWTWVQGGPYFGVPIGNFVGWFVVAIIASGIFRHFEYFFPVKEEKYDASVALIPVLCYGLVAFSFIFMAFQLRMYELEIVGCLVMFPSIVVNLILFRRYTSFQKKLRGKRG